MKLINKNADLFCPGGQPLEKTTHLCIAAHQDDVEIMATAPILECYASQDKWFSAAVLSDGAGSPRCGVYADYTNEDMMAVRAKEQRNAALVGGYLAIFQLGYSSTQIKQRENHTELIQEDSVAIDAFATRFIMDFLQAVQENLNSVL